MSVATGVEQCLGRHVRDGPKGIWMLAFEGGAGNFHLPIRCDRIGKGGENRGLCDACLEKEKKTVEKLGKMRPGVTTIGGMLPAYLHGRVTDPVPFWSRLVDGAWYRLKIEAGCKVSEEDMGKVKKAVAEAYRGVPMPLPEPEAMPGTVRSKGAKAAGGPKVPVTTTPPQVPKAPMAAPTAPIKKKDNTTIPPTLPPPLTTTAVALVQHVTQPYVVDTIKRTRVIPIQIQDRDVFYDPAKNRVYDLKYRCIGQYDKKADCIIGL